ncbi:MAG: hypothetical protein ABW352_23415 [Polyangiales bacterium]
MLNGSGRARLALSLCLLALALGPVPSARADGELQLAQARRAKKKKRPRSSPAAEPEPEGTPQPAWDDTEEDPEDGDSGADDVAPASGASAGSSDDMVISDPELAEAGTMSDSRGWGGMVPDGEASQTTASSGDEYDPLANTGMARLELIGQQGIDMHHEDYLEDAYESRLRFDAEVDFRRSRKLRMSVGVRTDLLWALPARGDPDLVQERMGITREYTPFQQDRWELDILPLSAFVDTTLGSAFHLRIGEQPVSIRRMDFYSPIDILAAFDMRGQPKLDPTSGRLAQPAVRVDWDLGSWATLQMVYVPWFMPNLSRPNRDRYVATVLGTQGAESSATLEDLIDPSYQTKSSESALRFVGPVPDFAHPQGQARLTMRGSGFEIGLSGGTALEKIPSVYLTPTAERFAQGKGSEDALIGFGTGQPLIDFAYHRYATFGVDGSLDLAPLSLGFEAAFSPSRHLTAATANGDHLPQPNVSKQITDNGNGMVSNVKDKSIRKGVPLIQAAFHVDWINGERFAIAAEAFVVKAMSLPYDLDRDWWGFIPGKGLYAGGLLGGSYTPNPDTGRLRFDLSLVSLVGPSFVVMPQVELKAREGLYLSLGAQIFEGPKPGQGGAQNVNLGGLFSGYDQFLLGFRYLP